MRPCIISAISILVFAFSAVAVEKNSEMKNAGAPNVLPSPRNEADDKCFNGNDLLACHGLMSRWETSRHGASVARRAVARLRELCATHARTCACADIAVQRSGIDKFAAMEIAVAKLGEGVRRVIPFRDTGAPQRIAVYYLQGEADFHSGTQRRFVGLLEKTEKGYVLTFRERHGDLYRCLDDLMVRDLDGDGESEVVFNNCDGCSCHVAKWTIVYSPRHRKRFTFDWESRRKRDRYSGNLKNPQAPPFLEWQQQVASKAFFDDFFDDWFLCDYPEGDTENSLMPTRAETVPRPEKRSRAQCTTFLDNPRAVWTLYGGDSIKLTDKPLIVDQAICEPPTSGMIYGISSNCVLEGARTLKKRTQPERGSFEISKVAELYNAFDPKSAALLANELFPGDKIVVRYILSATVHTQINSAQPAWLKDHPSCIAVRNAAESQETGGLQLEFVANDGTSLYKRDYGYRACQKNNGRWSGKACRTPIRLRFGAIPPRKLVKSTFEPSNLL